MKAIDEKFDIVRVIALRLGVKKFTVNSWRERNAVPSKWWIPLIINSNGLITLWDFLDDIDDRQKQVIMESL